VLSHIPPLREGKPAAGLRRFLDPLMDMLERYPNQPQILSVDSESGDSYRIPAVAVLNANDGCNEEQVEVELKDEFFKAKIGSRQAFEEYKADAIHRGNHSMTQRLPVWQMSLAVKKLNLFSSRHPILSMSKLIWRWILTMQLAALCATKCIATANWKRSQKQTGESYRYQRARIF
jgi:hypothetical protein